MIVFHDDRGIVYLYGIIRDKIKKQLFGLLEISNIVMHVDSFYKYTEDYLRIKYLFTVP